MSSPFDMSSFFNSCKNSHVRGRQKVFEVEDEKRRRFGNEEKETKEIEDGQKDLS